MSGQIEQLKEDISNRDRKIGRYEFDLAQLRERNAALTSEKIQLSLSLVNKTAEFQQSEQDIGSAREEAVELRDKLSKQTATNLELTVQMQDQKIQTESLRAQSQTTIHELLDRINKLIEHDEQDEKKLAELAKQLEQLAKALRTALADDESDKSTINQLRSSINDLHEVQKLLQGRIGELTGHDAQDEVQIEKLKKALAALESNLKDTT